MHVPGVDDFRMHGLALGKIQDLYVEWPQNLCMSTWHGMHKSDTFKNLAPTHEPKHLKNYTHTQEPKHLKNYTHTGTKTLKELDPHTNQNI